MLAIKLQRVGRKHQPSYRLVVAEKRSKMAAPPVEDLGSYNPLTKATNVKTERILHWMKLGAQPTVTANNLLVGQGILSTSKMAVKMPKAIAKAPVAPETSSVAAPFATATAVEEPVVVEEALQDVSDVPPSEA